MDTDDSTSSSDSETPAIGRDSPISRSASPDSNRSSSPEAPKSPESVQEPQHSSSSSPECPKSPNGGGDAKSPDSSSKDGASEASSIKKSDNDGNSSDSSEASVDSSSRKNKTIGKTVDTQPEEISDGDMESDHEKDQSHINNGKEKEEITAKKEVNISHEDLSDVSDLDESIGGNSDEENKEITENNVVTIENSTKPNEIVNNKDIDKPRPEDGEEQLDFEAEDGECEELPQDQKNNNASGIEDGETIEPALTEKEREELEEGEVTDEDDVRPEETEPRPVCRFFSRGQCTWGASCRFLHPGVTDKGNYTMFELIRPVVPGEYGREERPSNYGRPEQTAQIESAWERGLRTAKEMLRKSIKRKEQDIDFEEKKMNLTLAQEEFDKENGYYGRIPTSPEPRYVRHIPIDYPAPPTTAVVRASHLTAAPQPEEYYSSRRQVIYEPDYMPPPATTRERVRTSYRELPSHRMPDYYNNKYEDDIAMTPITQQTKVRTKPKREVIVQRIEERPVRGDEWSDPWMRSKSPAGRKSSGSAGGTTTTTSGGVGGGGVGVGGAGSTGRKRSYSSGSSYSSSSSSRSSSESSKSSFRSRSRSDAKVHTSRRRTRHNISPSVIVSERKAANERAALMNPPAPRKRAPSPSMMRVSASNPPAPVSSSAMQSVTTLKDQFGRTRSKLAVAAALARVNKGRNNRHSSKSSSDSSGSSSSDSDSSASSSSSSRDGSTPRRAGAEIVAKAMDALKSSSSATEKRQQIKLNLKNPTRKPDLAELARKSELLQGKKRAATSPPTVPTVTTISGSATSATDAKSKKATSRREELLKQLKAVEDAIAKKRSKVN